MADLDMFGTVDDIFVSVPASRTTRPNAYVDGLPVTGATTNESHTVNIQPMSLKEIQSLNIGGERINDVRKVYVNDGDLYSISPADDWSFTGVNGTFKTIHLDNRPWRNYCKIIVSRRDDT